MLSYEKDKPQMGNEPLQIKCLTKTYIHNMLILKIKIQNNTGGKKTSFKKWTKDLKKHFAKEHI